jgi:hypothetical protein
VLHTPTSFSLSVGCRCRRNRAFRSRRELSHRADSVRGLLSTSNPSRLVQLSVGFFFFVSNGLFTASYVVVNMNIHISNMRVCVCVAGSTGVPPIFHIVAAFVLEALIERKGGGEGRRRGGESGCIVS